MNKEEKEQDDGRDRPVHNLSIENVHSGLGRSITLDEVEGLIDRLDRLDPSAVEIAGGRPKVRALLLGKKQAWNKSIRFGPGDKSCLLAHLDRCFPKDGETSKAALAKATAAALMGVSKPGLLVASLGLSKQELFDGNLEVLFSEMSAAEAASFFLGRTIEKDNLQGVGTYLFTTSPYIQQLALRLAEIAGVDPFTLLAGE